MNIYGSDKPDLRFDSIFRILMIFLKIVNLESSKYNRGKWESQRYYFRGNHSESISRRVIDQYTELVKKNGLMGLVVLKYENDELGR